LRLESAQGTGRGCFPPAFGSRVPPWKGFNPELALARLREFVADHVSGEIPELSGMDYLRVDYCHNFQVGSALADYVHTLSQVSFLKHRRTTDGYGGVEWWSKNGRMIRAYDKFKEILEKDKKTVAEARGILRFEVEHKKSLDFSSGGSGTRN